MLDPHGKAGGQCTLGSVLLPVHRAVVTMRSSPLDVHKPMRQMTYRLLPPFTDEKTEAHSRVSAQHRKSTIRSSDFLGNFLPSDIKLYPR